MKPRIVFCLQAPTLLNILARSARWELSWTRAFEDVHLAETAECQVPEFRGPANEADIIVVSTPRQLERARKESRAKLVWALHNGLEPPACAATVSHFLALSHRVRSLVDGALGAYHEHTTHVVVPEYQSVLDILGDVQWRHVPGRVWIMKSRPGSRRPDHMRNVRYVADVARVPVDIYGEDAPSGFLDLQKKLELLLDSTAYLSALPLWAGFGLAEHECLTHGTPVIGTRWGDMPLEMPEGYGLSDDLDDLGHRLSDIKEEGPRAREMSSLGRQFIRDMRSALRMDRDIERFLDTLKP